MSRVLVVQYGCDAAACGRCAWTPVVGNDPANLPGDLPGNWTGTASRQFCPEHAGLARAHRPTPPAVYTHDGDCMCPDCHAERMAYCALTRGALNHRDHRIPSCPSRPTPPGETGPGGAA